MVSALSAHDSDCPAFEFDNCAIETRRPVTGEIRPAYAHYSAIGVELPWGIMTQFYAKIKGDLPSKIVADCIEL